MNVVNVGRKSLNKSMRNMMDVVLNAMRRNNSYRKKIWIKSTISNLANSLKDLESHFRS